MSYNTNNITRQQKESIFLLSIGTSLEYFDLMLYVHMTVLLNELFFPPSDPLTTQLITALAFCSTYVFRPIGGFVIGRIGDKIGRKKTIIITTSIMAACCITMANVPTYAEIGITASAIIITCRVLQGFSSMGELVGAKLYLAETLKKPYRYMYGGIVGAQSELGGFCALIVASFTISSSFNWRIAFWIGAVIALVGLVARTRLRETPDYVDFRRRLKIKTAIFDKLELLKNFSLNYKEKINKKAVFAYLLVRFIGPTCLFITYVTTGSFMKERFGFSSEDVIHQNAKVSMLTVIGILITAFFSKKHHPIKIAKIYITIFSVYLLFIPYWFD